MDASGNVSSIPSHCLCLWCVSFELETMPFRFQHPLGRTGRSCRRNPRILPALHARGGWRSHRREARRQRGRSDCQQITWVGFRYGNRTGDHMRAICIGIMVTFSCYGDAVVQHVVCGATIYEQSCVTDQILRIAGHVEIYGLPPMIVREITPSSLVPSNALMGLRPNNAFASTST